MRGTGQRKCYKLFGELPSSYSEAQFHCQQELASLINIESKEENDFLEELLNKALQEGKLEDTDIPSVWLGAQRKDAGLPFIWTSGKQIGFNNWPIQSKIQPDKMCVVSYKSEFIWSEFKNDWVWGPADCDDDNAHVCEKENLPLRDGGWSEWVSSECSAQCGNGIQIRKRFCNNPVPQNGGSNCEGDETTTRTCKVQNCQKQLVENVNIQVPEFLLKCKENYWIIDCDNFNFEYVLLIDQSGKFLEETETNEIKTFNTAVKKPSGMDAIINNEVNPRFLFKISWSSQYQGYFLKTSSNMYVVAEKASYENGSSKVQFEFCNTTCHGNKFIWKIWKINNIFISIESLEVSGQFLRVNHGQIILDVNNELFTGIKTNFIDKLSLERTKDTNYAKGMNSEAYGDVMVHYYSRTGENVKGYICDYNWDLADAEAVCRDLGYDTGFPTYDGEFTKTKNPYFVLSGVLCEEGTETFKTCPFKLEFPHDQYFVQTSLDQFDGTGYGCNRGIASDAAGVVCGNQETIGSILNREDQCENNTNAMTNLLKAFTSQKKVKKASIMMSESRDWFELLLAMPMSVSLTSTILLESSQFEKDLTLTSPSGLESPWKTLWGDSLQTNLLFLAHYISNAIEKANLKMGIVKYNSKSIKKYMLIVADNAFSKDEYEYNGLLKRHLKIIYKYSTDNIEQAEEAFKLFEKTQLLIQDLLFSLNVDKAKQKTLEVLTKCLASLQHESKDITNFFERVLNLIKISHSTFLHMEDFYNDISQLKGQTPRRTSIKRLKELNGDLMAYTFFLEKISRFYRKFSEDVLLTTNMNSFYLNLKKIDDHNALERYRKSLIDEAKSIQAEMMKEAAHQEGSNDNIGSQLYEITNKLQCQVDFNN